MSQLAKFWSQWRNTSDSGVKLKYCHEQGAFEEQISVLNVSFSFEDSAQLFKRCVLEIKTGDTVNTTINIFFCIRLFNYVLELAL